MSRLYAWLECDLSTTARTIRANRFLKVTVNYGSKSDSKPLFEAMVNFNSEPKVLIRYEGEVIELNRNHT